MHNYKVSEKYWAQFDTDEKLIEFAYSRLLKYSLKDLNKLAREWLSEIGAIEGKEFYIEYIIENNIDTDDVEYHELDTLDKWDLEDYIVSDMYFYTPSDVVLWLKDTNYFNLDKEILRSELIAFVENTFSDFDDWPDEQSIIEVFKNPNQLEFNFDEI